MRTLDRRSLSKWSEVGLIAKTLDSFSLKQKEKRPQTVMRTIALHISNIHIPAVSHTVVPLNEQPKTT